MSGTKRSNSAVQPGPTSAVQPSSSSEKLNKHVLLNALGKQDVGPLIRLYLQLVASRTPAQRQLLQHKHLSKVARADDGRPVLLTMKSPQFSRLFGGSGKAETEPSAETTPDARKAAKSKRSPQAWTDLRRLAHYLCDGERDTASEPEPKHSFYHAWLAKAMSGLQQQHSMRSVVAGTYLLFRPSIAFPGRFVIGLLVIYVTSDNAVATYEVNKLHGVSTDARLSAGRPGPLNIEEKHHGYAMRKSGRLLIRSWEESSGEEQAGIFSLLNDDHKKYTHVIDGHYLGVHSTSGPTSRPVVLLRQGDCPSPMSNRDELSAFLSSEDAVELQKQVGIVEWGELPPLVRARLSHAAGSMAIYDVPTTST